MGWEAKEQLLRGTSIETTIVDNHCEYASLMAKLRLMNALPDYVCKRIGEVGIVIKSPVHVYVQVPEVGTYTEEYEGFPSDELIANLLLAAG